MAVYARARVGRGTSAQGFYAQRLRFGDLAFDIGAWRGQHTAAMLRRGARVVALEPQADLARQIERDFPAATVLPLAVSDRPGEGTLMTSGSNSDLSTLNPAQLDDPFLAGTSWEGTVKVRLTTLDELIAEFGLPTFVKIDTEGLEDKVLAGLSRPVGGLLFEVRSALPDVVARSFESLAALGVYEYRLTRNDPRSLVAEPWVFGPRVSPEEILADLPNWGDVYARRIDQP